MKQIERQAEESKPDTTNEFITVVQAAKMSPGRPSANAVWRWARRGVLSRGGERISLEHIRVGGKLFTTESWVREFGKRLAAADAAHFDRRGDSQVAAPMLSPAEVKRREHLAQIDRDLTEAGL